MALIPDFRKTAKKPEMKLKMNKMNNFFLKFSFHDAKLNGGAKLQESQIILIPGAYTIL